VNKPEHSPEMAPGFRAIRFSRDWITRPVFAVLLAAAVMTAIFTGRPYLEFVVALAVTLAAREWHRMVGEGRFLPELAASTVVIWLALAVYLLSPVRYLPVMVLASGTLLQFVLCVLRRNNPLWHAAGVLYLGLPALAILALRDFTPHGAWVLIGLFLIVWATDTGAFIVGNLVGGPKLAPVLSPNKTWSGAIGGLIAAAAVQAVFIAILGGHVVAAAVFAACIGVVAHLGDLFESWVKRHFHLKNSGSLIPGHGGILDRIDSTLATLVVLALIVFVFKFDPLFGALS
jgi:phosphatidate cytidylyltransferase